MELNDAVSQSGISVSGDEEDETSFKVSIKLGSLSEDQVLNVLIEQELSCLVKAI